MRLFKKRTAQELSGRSLDRMAWRRFRRNPLSVASLVVIGLFVLVDLLGYLITPDHTPHCNQQYLELATLHPGAKATFLCIDPVQPATGSLLTGRPLPYTAIPVDTYRIDADSVHAVPLAGEPLTIARDRMVKVQ